MKYIIRTFYQMLDPQKSYIRKRSAILRGPGGFPVVCHIETASLEDDGGSLKNAVGGTLAIRANLFRIYL